MGVKHGTTWSYAKGCRCGGCRAAHADSARRYRLRVALREVRRERARAYRRARYLALKIGGAA